MSRYLTLMSMAAAVIVTAATLTFGGATSAAPYPATTTTTQARTEPTAEQIAGWVAALKRAEARRRHVADLFRRLHEHHVAELFRRLAAHAAAERARAAARAYPHGLCGGDLPPCYVMHRESRGDYRIWNGGCHAPYGWTGRRSPCGGSTASGKWQMIRGTWARYGGYLNAADAPEKVQDAKARELWARGRGCSHWAAC